MTAGYRSTVPAGRDGFGALLRAEWTKFRTVRAWVVGLGVAVLLTVGFGVLVAVGSHSQVVSAGGGPVQGPPPIPTGPDGEAVTDGYFLLHQTLTGDGSITARITGMTGEVMSPGPDGPAGPGAAPTPAALMPWAKAGVVVKNGTSAGSAYAAVMITGSHGVRMQYNYTGDVAGPSGDASTVSESSPRWLRLTRSGATLTGYTSTDGSTWTEVGSTDLTGLPSSVEIGLFVASPPKETIKQVLGGSTGTEEPTQATVSFDDIAVTGTTSGTWTPTKIGGDDTPGAGDAHASPSGYVISGSGDIAPDADTDRGGNVQHIVVGAFAGITVVIIVAVLFITTEYRRGMIRTTLVASPRRPRVLAAKAIVVGAVTFVTGLVAVGVVVPLGRHLLATGGHILQPMPWPLLVQLVVGTAALMAVAAVLALGLGALFKRSVGAVAAGVVLIIVPYILTSAEILPPGAANWVLRFSPAAAFAVQQTIPRYPQVDAFYTPGRGFYPLSPWLGFAVLCVWAVAVLGLGAYRLRRRDV